MARVLKAFAIAAILFSLLWQSTKAQEIAVGERVKVKAATTNVMSGSDSLGAVPRGTEFLVEQTGGGGAWLSGQFAINGKPVKGWVRSADVARSGGIASVPGAMPARPVASSSPPPALSTGQVKLRYTAQYDAPAMMYGFLPLRQDMSDTTIAFAVAQYGFDPSTVREAETERLLQSLGTDPGIDAVLEQVRKKIVAAESLDLSKYSLQSLKLAEVDPDLQLLLDKCKLSLFTDAYEAATRAQKRLSQNGADHPHAALGLAWLMYMRRLNGGEAVETTHHWMLDWARRTYGEDHPYTARCWSNLALVRHDRTDFEAARRILLRGLQSRSQESSVLAEDVPLMLLNLARVLETEGRAEESLRCGALAREIVRVLPAPVRQRIAGSCFHEFADLELAATGGFPFYVRSGLVYRPNSTSFIGFGGTPQRGDKNEQVSSGFDTLSMAQIVGKGGGYAHTPYMLAATHYSRRGDLAAAERFGRKTIELAKRDFSNKPELRWHITMNQQMLAYTLNSIGNHEAAIELIQDAIQIQYPLWAEEWKSVQSSKGTSQYLAFSAHSIYIQLLLLNAKSHYETNQFAEAERLYRDALVVAQLPTSISTNTMVRNTSHAPQCQAELATVLLKLGKVDEAEKLFRESLAYDYARWCFNFWKEVRMYYGLTGLATILESRGGADNLAKASLMYQDGFLLMTKDPGSMRGGGSHRQMLDYARALQRQGRYAEAVLVLQISISAIEASRRQVGGDELNRARFFSELTKNDPYSALAQLQLEVGDGFADHFGVGEFGARAAFDTLEQGRGRALLDLMSRGGGDIASAALMYARSKNDAALLARVEQLRSEELAARDQGAKIIDQGAAAASNAAAVAQLQTQLNKVREQEREANRALFDIAKGLLEKEAMQPLTLPQAAKTLLPNEAILVYDVGPARSLLLTVLPDGTVDGKFLQWPDGKPVTERDLSLSIGDFFQEVSREESPKSSSAGKVYSPNELRQALLPDAVVASLAGCRRWFVVGDGPLHRLPFESLFTDDDGQKYLLDQSPAIAYGPSATILLYPRLQPKKPTASSRMELVALGDPQFTQGTAVEGNQAKAGDAAAIRTRSLTRFGTLTPLPGTRAEIDVIRQTMLGKDAATTDRVKVLSGAEASVTNLFRDTNQPRYLHLATHGLAEGGRKAFDSALAMAAPKTITANDTGFLRLSDLLAQWGGKLDGTELVVLSACRTARGEMESGDGFVALTWGFLFAGSRNVIASLWEVDDTATALLMSRLYENLLGRFDQPRVVAGESYAAGIPMPPAAALHEAKTWLRNLDRKNAEEVVAKLLQQSRQLPGGERPFADPFYWGAFLLFGGEATEAKAGS